MHMTFLGATGTVTGSKYLVETGERRVLLDCGLFQGLKQLRLRNRDRLPVAPARIDAVVLTHAHLDHSGYLPVLVRDGFRGPVYCTPATRDLLGILLPDSGHLQEEEADFANRHGYSRHRHALPLYTERDAQEALNRLVPIDFGETKDLGGGAEFTYHVAGHILGAAMVSFRHRGRHILFSGDLGRLHDPMMPPPAVVRQADYVVVESTYGGRRHPDVDPLEELGEVLRRTALRGGSVIIPAFAVGRTQHLLYLIHRLKAEGRMPQLPVYLDSPMATRATEIFRAHAQRLRLSVADARSVCAAAVPVASVEQSKALDRTPGPKVIISASGMATGGRVLHHLKVFAPDRRNTILFSGFQAAGTRGARMASGADSVKIHGQYVPVRAEVRLLESLSAHADEREIMEWLGGFESAPRMTFVTHGEPVAADAVRHRIQERLGWPVRVPEYRERYTMVPSARRPRRVAALAAGEGS